MKSPFKFLDSFTRDDRNVFFGRNHEIEELYRRIFEGKIMLVYGVSGTGKSSLIHCGLANKFQETDWLPIVIRRGENIVESLAAGIKAASVTSGEDVIAGPAGFKKAVRSLYLDHYKPIFFIFDQFEELFIFGDREERRSFIQIVKSLTESDLQCRLIFIMREEYMAGVTEFEKYIPAFFANRVRIEKMSHINALEAIKGPCKIFNINIEEGFAESLLEKLSPGSEDVELTYLQVFLDKIFRLATGFLPPPGSLSSDSGRKLKGGSTMAGGESKEEPPHSQAGQPSPTLTPTLHFTLSLLSKTGNVSDLLGSYLEEQIALLDDPDKGLAVLKSFVSVKGTKRQMSLDEVAEYTQTLGQQIDNQRLTDLLQTFINLRILRDKDQNGRYELRHDALASKIYEKITLIEKELLEIRTFIENAYSNWKKRHIFLSAEDLNYIAPYESRLFLHDEYNDFIERSKYELQRKKIQRRYVAVTTGLGLIIAFACFTVWALVERNKTKKQEILAKSNYFSSLSREFADADPTKALRIAEYACRINPTEENRKNLVSIYSANEFYSTFIPFITPDLRLNYFFKTLDNSGGVAVIARKSLRLFDNNGKYLKSIPLNSYEYSFEISHDENYLLINYYDDTIRLYNLADNSLLKFKAQTDVRLKKWYNEMEFFPDSKKFLTINDSKEITVWSLNGEIIRRSDVFEKYSSVITPVTGNKVLVCSLHGTLYKWNIQNNTISEARLPLRKELLLKNPVQLPDGRIALIRSDNFICIYDTTGKCSIEWPINYQTDKIVTLPGKKLLLTWNENVIDLWDYNGNNVKKIRSGTTISDVQYDRLPDLILFSTENMISSFPAQVTTDSLILRTNGDIYLGYSEDTLIIFPIGRDKTENRPVQLYDESGNLRKNFILPDKFLYPYQSGSGRFIVIGNYSRPFLTFFDIKSDTRNFPADVSEWPYLISFSKDFSKTALAGKIFSDSVYNFINDFAERSFSILGREGKLLKRISTIDYITALQMSDDGKYILAAESDNAVLWDSDGKRISSFKGHDGTICSLDISEDDRYVITGSYDRTTRLWSADGKLLRIIPTHNMGNSIKVKFVDHDRLFLAYDKNQIKVYDSAGKLMQLVAGSIPSQTWEECFYSSPTGSLVYHDPVRGGVARSVIKQPVDSFIIKNNNTGLPVSQRLEYGLVSVEDLLSSGSFNDCYFAAVYLMYFKSTKAISQNEIKQTLDDAEKLFIKGLSTDPDPFRIYDKLTELYIREYHSLDENIAGKIEKYFRLIYLSENSDFLIYAGDTYSGLLDKSTFGFGFHNKALTLYKKALKIDKQIASEIAGDCSDLSASLIDLKEFKAALDASITGFEADSSNPYIFTTLPLAYIFNDQYSKAEKIYGEWKDRPWTIEPNYNTFGQVFLADIEELENKGITHPDFAKAKEVLKK